MNNEEINQGRKKYKRLLSKKERELEIQKQIELLENNPYVKRYLSLINEKKEITNVDTNILYSAFGDIIKSTKDNMNIFIYMGYFILDNIKYYYYYNIESGKKIKINCEDYKKFEKENKILFPVNDKYRRILLFGYIDICLAIREEYLNNLLISDKEKCVKELIKKYQNV